MAAAAVQAVPLPIDIHDALLVDATEEPRKLPTPPAGSAPLGSMASKLGSLRHTPPRQPQSHLISPAVLQTDPPSQTPVEPDLGGQAVAAQALRETLSKPPPGAHAPTSPAQGSKLPSASPQRGRRLSPGPRRPSPRVGAAPVPGEGAISENGLEQQGSHGSQSPQRYAWNQYNESARPVKPPAVLSTVSDEERLKRRQWAIEKRRKEMARSQVDSLRRAAEDAKKKTDEESKLESRRLAVRERIARQQEVAAKLAVERTAADERARAELAKFKGKPLHERLIEEYERVRAIDDEAKRARADEELRMRNVRPHQLIAGEVTVKPLPSQSPGRERSAGRDTVGHGGAAFSAGRHLLAGASQPQHSLGLHAEASAEGGGLSPVAAPMMARPKPRTQGTVLYSTRPKGAARPLGALHRLVERGNSPFIFDTGGSPANVPEQAQFWPNASVANSAIETHAAAAAEGNAAPSEVLTLEKSEEQVHLPVHVPVLALPTEESADMPQQASPTTSTAAAANASASVPPSLEASQFSVISEPSYPNPNITSYNPPATHPAAPVHVAHAPAEEEREAESNAVVEEAEAEGDAADQAAEAEEGVVPEGAGPGVEAPAETEESAVDAPALVAEGSVVEVREDVATDHPEAEGAEGVPSAEEAAAGEGTEEVPAAEPSEAVSSVEGASA